ncbi:MAG: hypothetical protein KF896_12920 [Ignavibacteriae bacterium]|nr:hypothetical protein [Ignavibacteriota bacterium]
MYKLEFIKLKKILYSLFFIVIGFASTINLVKSQDINCTEWDANCDDPGGWQSSFKDIEADGFPGCSLRVNYKWRQCIGQTPHTTQWVIESVFILNGTSCTNLILWLTNNGTGITSNNISELKRSIIRQISLINFIAWYDNAIPAIKAQVECGTGYHVKTTYYQKVCAKVCFSSFDIGGELIYSLVEVPCIDSQGCCGITYKYCMLNGVPQITTEVTGHEINCYVSPFPDPSGCPINTVDQEIIDCHDNCVSE